MEAQYTFNFTRLLAIIFFRYYQWTFDQGVKSKKSVQFLRFHVIVMLQTSCKDVGAFAEWTNVLALYNRGGWILLCNGSGGLDILLYHGHFLHLGLIEHVDL